MTHRITARLARLIHRPPPPRRAQTMSGVRTEPGPPPSVPDWFKPSWAERQAAEDAARRSTPLPPPDPGPHLQWWEKALIRDAADRAAIAEQAAERARNPAPVDGLADSHAWLGRQWGRGQRRDG